MEADGSEVPLPEHHFSISRLEELVLPVFMAYIDATEKLKVYRDVKDEYHLYQKSPASFSTSRLEVLHGNLIQAREAFLNVLETGAGAIAVSNIYNKLLHGIESTPSPEDPTQSQTYYILKSHSIVKKYLPVMERAISEVSSRLS